MDETTALKKFDRLAHKTAKFYFDRSGGKHDYEDLYQAARLGILEAARQFKPELGYKFITYAYRCAQTSVQKYVRDNRGLIHVPQTANESNYVTVVDSATAETLLEFKAGDDDTSTSERTLVLAEAMAVIPEKQREVIRLVYFEEMTYEEAAAELGISKQYAHQLTTRGLASLQSVLGESLQML